MAGSRLEKIGTIFSRTTGLIRSGAMKFEDRPLWYDVYEAFPPKEEPRFDRAAPNLPIRQIFYEEDKIRALFHRNNKNIGRINLLDTKSKSLTQRFIETYQKIQSQYEDEQTEEKLYQETVDLVKREREAKFAQAQAVDEGEGDEINLSTTYKPPLKEPEQPPLNVKIKDIFKE